jgi:acyl-CoA reductase-like NAD-dependent aldehyde dehydrogenase
MKVFTIKLDAVVAAYKQLSIGNPLDENNVGPLIDTDAVAMYNSALTRVVEEGKTLLKVVFFQEKGTKDVT